MMVEILVRGLAVLSIAMCVIVLWLGSVGLSKLPDVYCRIHAVGMLDTAGASFIILGMIIHQGFSLVSFKLALIGVFLFFTSPIATHAVAQVAHKLGVKPVGRNLVKATPPKKIKPQKSNAKTAKGKS